MERKYYTTPELLKELKPGQYAKMIGASSSGIVYKDYYGHIRWKSNRELVPLMKWVVNGYWEVIEEKDD